MENHSIPALVDSTLRDGEQAPGVIFTFREKLRIAALLGSMRIPEAEIGFPGMGEEEETTVRKLVQSGFGFRNICWCRAIESDIDAAHRTGAEAVNISFPVSDILLGAMGKNRQWLAEAFSSLIPYARARFKYVYAGLQDATRAGFNELCACTEILSRLGVDRIRIADTVGIACPSQIREIITGLTRRIAVQLEFHGHNDLGMATANTLTAIEAGAGCVSVTVNGIGERAGNAPLEEVAMSLKHSLGLDTGIDHSLIQHLCAVTAAASGRNIPAAKPVTGQMVLAHESGIHTNCIIRNVRSYQPFTAEEVGSRENEFVFGKHSGSAALIDFLGRSGYRIGKSEANLMIRKIKTESEKKKRALHESELMDIFARSQRISA